MNVDREIAAIERKIISDRAKMTRRYAAIDLIRDDISRLHMSIDGLQVALRKLKADAHAQR